MVTDALLSRCAARGMPVSVRRVPHCSDHILVRVVHMSPTYTSNTCTQPRLVYFFSLADDAWVILQMRFALSSRS